MQNGVKSEGWLLTDRASWRHDNGGVDAQNRQIKTHKHTTDGGRRNRTNRIKIRQKEIKVRMNDVSVVAGGKVFLTWGRHGSKDPGALICCFFLFFLV